MSGCIQKSASVSVTSIDLYILHTIQLYFLITAPRIGWRVHKYRLTWQFVVCYGFDKQVMTVTMICLFAKQKK